MIIVIILHRWWLVGLKRHRRRLGVAIIPSTLAYAADAHVEKREAIRARIEEKFVVTPQAIVNVHSPYIGRLESTVPRVLIKVQCQVFSVKQHSRVRILAPSPYEYVCNHSHEEVDSGQNWFRDFLGIKENAMVAYELNVRGSFLWLKGRNFDCTLWSLDSNYKNLIHLPTH